MPVEYKIDTNRKLIIGKGFGEIKHRDLTKIVQDIVAHPDYDSGYNELWDIREATKLMSFFEQTISRVESECEVRKITTPNREAIIVANSLQFGIARQYAILAEKIPLHVEVFFNYERGLSWVMEEE